MDKGAKAIVIMLLVALVLGTVVILLHPTYRGAAVSLLRGQPTASPLWQSNLEYYPEIALPRASENTNAE